MKFTRITGKSPDKNAPRKAPTIGAPSAGSGDKAAAKSIFTLEPNMHIRFNNDGWVEELGKGNKEGMPPGTSLGGLSSSKLDDLYARRFYDLYARVIIFDIHPRRENDFTRASGLMQFRDIDPDSPIYLRVNKIIGLANEHFQMNIKPLA